MVESQRGDINHVHGDYQCQHYRQAQSRSHTVFGQGIEAMNSSDFSLLNWNLQKGNTKGWQEDLMRLSKETDLLLIQEAYLSEKLRLLLKNGQYHWDLVEAFTYNGAKAGVLTASRIEPDLVCPLRALDPLLGVPKTMLTTRYPLSETHQWLLVANIHMINFTLGTLEFRDQLNRLVTRLEKHTGPLIISGDFNTWSPQRMVIVDIIADRLGLKPLRFKENNLREVFGLIVDHIYYRELEPIGRNVVKVKSSDHNPMLVRFKLNHDE
jgi:endonuclease/exonuclease/phosphatase (EEP) superfamily protein YafD